MPIRGTRLSSGDRWRSTSLTESMLFWAVESGKVSDLKPPGHVLSATGCVVVAKLQQEEGTTAGPPGSSVAARVLSGLAH